MRQKNTFCLVSGEQEEGAGTGEHPDISSLHVSQSSGRTLRESCLNRRGGLASARRAAARRASRAQGTQALGLIWRRQGGLPAIFVQNFMAGLGSKATRTPPEGSGRCNQQFFAWCARYGLTLETVDPVHLATFVEQLGRELAAPSVKQHLTAVRMLYDWLVIGQVVPVNPAASVREPKHVVKTGRTPIPATDEARALLESIPTDSLVGLRDRAAIGTLLYTFARVGVATTLRVEDYFPQGKRWWVGCMRRVGRCIRCRCIIAWRSISIAILRRQG